MNDIIISVICLTYNQNKYIEKCLDSLVNQETSFAYEILIHDDASTDGTIKMLKKYEKRYPQLIKVFYEEENQYSKGIKVEEILYKNAKGKYFAFCEGDDYWTDHQKLQIQYNIMERYKDCTLCAHKVRKMTNSGTELKSIICPNDFRPGIIQGDHFLREYLKGDVNMLFQTSSYLIRKEIILGRPKELNLFGVGDVPMMIWAAYKGNIFYLDRICSNYRVAADGSTNQLSRKVDYAINRIKTNIAGFEAFNKLTNGKYWTAMKHRVYYYKAQCFFYDCSYKDEIETIKSELSKKQILIARIKFTKYGNVIRNFRISLRMFRLFRIT